MGELSLFWKKKIRVIIFIFSLIVCSHFVLMSSFAGLPPSEMMPEWYLLDSINEDGANYLSMFPFMSQYSDCGNYTRHTMMCVWYFDEKTAFLESEASLSRYLVESGNVDVVELDINDEINEVVKVRESKNQWRPTLGPKIFNATRYESDLTSGYFLVYSQPFLEAREDYFIVYYGTRENGSLTDQGPILEKLIAKSYYLGEGEVKSLNLSSGDAESRKGVPGFELLGGLISFCCAGLYLHKRRKLT